MQCLIFQIHEKKENAMSDFSNTRKNVSEVNGGGGLNL